MYDKQIEELKAQISNGYVYFIDYEHPLAIGNSGKVYYHRHVASLVLGRWLEPGEHVHHLDGDKENNEPENLVVVTNGEHQNLHRGPRRQKKCKACGKKFTVWHKRSIYCSQGCSKIGSRRVDRPDQEVLRREVEELGYCAVGRKYGVSDNAIRKWLR